MRTNLRAISWVCAILLALLVLVPRIRKNVASLALIVWLVLANLIHAINASIWADNTELHVPGWCDLVTKLLLGVTVALPGACLAMARRLELVSSERAVVLDPRSRRDNLLIELGLCYALPLIYMMIDFFVQDHRFDLLADFGCSASIHPSAAGILVMGLPPVVLCIMSFVLCGLTVHNSFLHTNAHFTCHNEKRSLLTSSTFSRQLVITIVTTTVLLVVTIFSLSSASLVGPWPSWLEVHNEVAVIHIVTSPNKRHPIELTWWGVPIVSLTLLLLLIAIGEEGREAIKCLKNMFIRQSKNKGKPLQLVLPIHYPAAKRSETSPEPFELKSGWDDMLEPEPQPRWPFLKKLYRLFLPSTPPSAPLRTASPILPLPEPKTIYKEDKTSEAPSMDCKSHSIQSDAIKPRFSSLVSPPPAYASPRKETHQSYCSRSLSSSTSTRFVFSPGSSMVRPLGKPPRIIPRRIPRPPITTPPVPPRPRTPVPRKLDLRNVPPTPRSVPNDILASPPSSLSSSLFEAAWPEPPDSLPPWPAPAHLSIHAHSIPTSPTFSMISPPTSATSEIRLEYALCTAATSLGRQASASSMGSVLVSMPQTRPLKVSKRHRRPSLRRLRSARAGKAPPEDVIYMTVMGSSP